MMDEQTLAEIKHILKIDKKLSVSDAPNRLVLQHLLAASVKHRERLLAEVGRLEAEAAALRGALEAVEWVFRTGTGYCPWCRMPFKIGHAPDCLHELALAADAGRAPLERRRADQYDLETKMKVEDVCIWDEEIFLTLRNLWFPEGTVTITFAGAGDAVKKNDVVKLNLSIEENDSRVPIEEASCPAPGASIAELMERENLFAFWVDQKASPRFPAYRVWVVGRWPKDGYMNFFAGETHDTEIELTLDGAASEIAYADSLSFAVRRFLEAYERCGHVDARQD